jgi:hypothetical protein
MKHCKVTTYCTTTAIAALLLGASLPAIAQDAPATKGPPVTMGDQGKLPATDTVSGKVPEMGATGASSGEQGAGSASTKGPPQRMGGEGKLPATGTVSGAVPQMTPPAKSGE